MYLNRIKSQVLVIWRQFIIRIIGKLKSQIIKRKIQALSNISLSSYDHFRVYVPKDIVSTEKKEVTVVFNYKFEVISGYYYKANGHQTVTMLGTLPKEVSDGETFQIVKVPDTATDISGTIYVVGLIVLLSGLGILYINVRKQKTQTQQ